MGHGFIYGQNNNKTNTVMPTYWIQWIPPHEYNIINNIILEPAWVAMDQKLFCLGMEFTVIQLDEKYQVTITINDKNIEKEISGTEDIQFSPSIEIGDFTISIMKILIGEDNFSVQIPIKEKIQKEFNKTFWNAAAIIASNEVNELPPINNYDPNGYYYEFYGTIKPDFTF